MATAERQATTGKERLLEEIRRECIALGEKKGPSLAGKLARYPEETIRLTRDVLAEQAKHGYPGETGSLAKTIRALLDYKRFNDNLPQMLQLLHETAKHGRKTAMLGDTILYMLGTPKDLTEKNLPQILPALYEHARHGHDARHLVRVITQAIAARRFVTKQNLPPIMKEIRAHAEAGKDAAAITAFLANRPEKLGEAKAAREHLMRATDFLHGVETEEDHEKVTVPLFNHVMRTHKTELPKMGGKAYWQWIGLQAKELKAIKASVK